MPAGARSAACRAGLLALLVLALRASPAAAQTCSDKAKNGNETDVDCGGPACPPCLTARSCLANTDCLSGACSSGRCQQPPECFNKVQDRRETDVDCGGGECYAACWLGKRCATTWDCRSSVCTNGICQQAATCGNWAVDGLETDLNCGGGVCEPCASHQRCTQAADCRSGVCTSGLCTAPASCRDGVLSSGESDADCGGQQCALCGTWKLCKANGDCLSNNCVSGRCNEAPYCRNGLKDGRETDVDCGGGGCDAACAVGQRCGGKWDCVTRICGASGVCEAPPSPSPSPGPPSPSPGPPSPSPVRPSPSPSPAVPSPSPVPEPSCADGIQNQAEADVDCGGPNCPPCDSGRLCFEHSDCGSGTCVW